VDFVIFSIDTFCYWDGNFYKYKKIIFFFIKLGYLTGSIFQKSTINSINPTDAENILAESYSDETGETEIYANSNEPMQIAIPIVPERGGSRKRRFRKKKSKTKKNKRI